MKKWAQKQTGFTIVELLIVVVVIAILASITVVAYNGIQQQARDSQRRADMDAIAKALSMHNVERGAFPNTGGGSSTGEGWFNGGSPTLLTVLQSAGYLTNQQIRDPVTLTGSTATTSGYLVTYCGTGDARRAIIYGRLESSPAASLPAEFSDCSSGARGWWMTYGCNYYKVGY